MGLFGGTGPVLGGSAGGQNYSLASMLDRANAKKSGTGLYPMLPLADAMSLVLRGVHVKHISKMTVLMDVEQIRLVQNLMDSNFLPFSPRPGTDHLSLYRGQQRRRSQGQEGLGRPTNVNRHAFNFLNHTGILPRLCCSCAEGLCYMCKGFPWLLKH